MSETAPSGRGHRRSGGAQQGVARGQDASADGLMAGGVSIDELVLADQPERWSALGFLVSGGVCQLRSVRLRLAGGEDSRTGILGWSLRGLRGDGVELDGLPTTRSQGAPPPPGGPHPNGVLAVDHVVVMTPVLERTVQALESGGMQLRRIREQPTPAGAPRQAFFRLGEEILEVVQEPQAIVERDGGPDRPARLWGLALTVDDLDRAADQMGPHLGDARAAVQPGRRIATLRRSAGLGVPIALMTPAPERA